MKAVTFGALAAGAGPVHRQRFEWFMEGGRDSVSFVKRFCFAVLQLLDEYTLRRLLAYEPGRRYCSFFCHSNRDLNHIQQNSLKKLKTCVA